MSPTLSKLTRPLQVSYILSSALMAGGWLFLLALTLEWSPPHWSRPALALQAAAFVVALLVLRHIQAQRLAVYPLILAVSIYLLDTTLPPPNFPSGWPREIIPRLVLVGLLFDCLRTIHWGRARHGAGQRKPGNVSLDDAIRLLGLTPGELRIRLQRRGIAITVDAAGREYLSADQLRLLQQGMKPAWWQLYAGLLLLSGALLFAIPLIPPTWEMAAQGLWCVLTLGGMWLWVWLNQEALHDEDRANQGADKYDDPGPAEDDGRTIPLTPVQKRFLEVMKRRKDQ
jgi:hypothetical protein